MLSLRGASATKQSLVNTRGFSLLEVMVSVAILGVIMTLVWSSTSQSIGAKERIEKRDLIYHTGGVLLRKLAEDVSMSFLAKHAQAGQIATPEAAAAAAKEPAFKTFFIAEDSGDRDALRFSSFSHIRFFKDAKESDQCRVSYEVTASTDERGLYNVVRREDPWLGDKTEVEGEPLILAEGIKDFNLEYYNTATNEWVKTWDTEKQDWKDKLPAAVMINVTFVDPNDEDKLIPLSTAVMIPMSKGLVEF